MPGIVVDDQGGALSSIPAALPDDDDRLATIAELNQVLDTAESLPRDNVEQSYQQAVNVEMLARGLADTRLQIRAQLLQAHILSRHCLTSSCSTLLKRAKRWADENNDHHLQARIHRLFSFLFRTIGDNSQSLEHAVRALRLIDETTPALHILEYHLAYADALAVNRYRDAAYSSYHKTAERAVELEQWATQALAINNLAYLALILGDIDTAQRAIAECQDVSATHHLPPDPDVLDTTARLAMALGNPHEALAALEPLIQQSKQRPTPVYSMAQAMLTLAEVYRALGRNAEAESTLALCSSMARRGALRQIDIQSLELQATMRAEANDFPAAYALQHQARVLSEQLHCDEQDLRTRTLNAYYEAENARREGEKYRQLSLSDPLTGIPNRRYVDQELPILLETQSLATQPVTVAIVDVDHFKRINDQYSHEAGDLVLTRLAKILQETVARQWQWLALESRTVDCLNPPAFVARWGGEEFLLVLPSCGAGEGKAVLDRISATIEDTRWDMIDPALQLTISIGAVSARHLTDPPPLIASADQNLYQAKISGRNCVVLTTAGYAEADRQMTRRQYRELLSFHQGPTENQAAQPDSEQRTTMMILRRTTPTDSADVIPFTPSAISQ